MVVIALETTWNQHLRPFAFHLRICSSLPPHVNGNALAVSGSGVGTTVYGVDFTCTNSANELLITAIPGPSNFVMLFGGLGMMLGIKRSRRRL